MMTPDRSDCAASRSTVVLLNPPFDGQVVRDNYCSFVPKGDYLWPPSDLLVASGWLHGEFELRVIDAVARQLSTRACLDELSAARPTAVFVLSAEATWASDATFCDRLRAALPDLRIVVGCSPLAGSDLTRRFPTADAVLLDFSGPALSDYLRRGASTPDHLLLPGDVRRGPVTFCAEYPLPRHELIDPRHYALPLGWSGGLTTVLTSIGCAHHCEFCAGGALPYARRPLEQVIEELEHVRGLGIRNLFFADYTFTTPRRYLLDLCAEMTRREFGFRWTALARPDQLDDETVRAMVGSGCALIQLGVESGDDRILERYRKGFTVAQVREAFVVCRRAGLPTLGFFILGLPGEDEGTVRRTIDLAMELDPDLASFAMPTPDPGSVLSAAAGDGEVRSTSYPIVESEQLDEATIRRLHAAAVWRFYARPRFLARQLRESASAGDLGRKLAGGARLLRSALRNRISSRRRY